MEVKKAIKKVIALGTGITMLGATILGAMAQDLADYPKPFVEDGKFNAFIVVGDSAAAEDVVGAVDIGASLQFEMKKTVEIATGVAATAMIDDGVKVEKTGDDLNIFTAKTDGGLEADDIENIQSTFDEEDLPVILADESFVESKGETDNDETYTQTLNFYNNTGRILFDQDDSDAPEAGYYLWFDDASNVYMYMYELEFDSEVEHVNASTTTYACADIEDDYNGAKLRIQGRDYTITDVECDGNNIPEKFTLMAGETTMWLTQDQVITKIVAGEQHEIMVVDVTEQEDSCGVSVDGDVVWIDTDDTETINGVTIGVTDAKAVHAQLQDVDICEINVGAQEVVLEDGKEVEVGGVEVDGSQVNLDITATTWDGFNITYVPEDEVYLAEGESVMDPVLGNFEITYAGITKVSEDISYTVGSSSGELVFMNNDGKEVEIPVLYLDNTTKNSVVFGNDEDELLLFADSQVCDVGTGDVRDCEGWQILFLTSGGEAHMLEIADIDTTDQDIDLRDVTYSKTYDNEDYSGGTIDLGSLGTFSITVNAGNLVVSAGTGTIGGQIKTENEGVLNISATCGPASANLTATCVETPLNNGTTIIFDESDNPDDTARTIISIVTVGDSTDEELQVNRPTEVSGALGDWADESEDNDDDIWATTEYGTLVKYDDEDKQGAWISYPEEEAIANVFISPTGAKVTTTGGGGAVETTQIERINVGAARLASEVDVDETNLIVVGGPCANAIAAEVMGNPADCTAGFEEGKAIVKLYDTGSNVAMLVAGYSALDTRRATRVVSNFGAYDLSGDEVEVSGTSLTNINVNVPG